MLKKQVDRIVEKYATHIEALVLVGSLSRGEEVVCHNNGKTELLSDIEFLAVIKTETFGKIDKNFDTFGGRLSVGFTTKKHLKKLKPYIFTVEAKKFGRVLWGDKDTLNLIPDYSYEELEPIDGFILLNNRIVEQLIIWQGISSNKPVRQYDIVKGYIQLVNSYLAVNRAYKSLYPEKLSKFIELSPSHQVTRSPALIKKVREAFDFVKNPNGDIIPNEKVLTEWKELRKHYRHLWEEQSRIFANHLSFIECMRGWLKVLLDSKKRSLFSFTEIVANFLRTSPQFLIY